MIYYKYFKFLCNVSLIAGFRFIHPPFLDKINACTRFLWNAYNWFSDLVLMIYVLRITGRFFTYMTTGQILETIPTFFYVSQVFIKSMILRYKAKPLDIYIFRLNEYLMEVETDESFKHVWRRNYTVSNTLCKVLFWSQAFGLALSFAPSLYRIIAAPEADVIKFSAVYLFRDYHFGFKVFYLGLDLVSSIFCIVKVSAIESLYLTCVVFHICQLEHLKIWLQNVYERKAFHELKKWTKNHQDALSLTNHLKVLIAPLLFVVYVYNLINIATMAMYVTANGDLHKLQRVLGGIVVSVTMIYFSWGCMQTDILEQLHAEVANHAYRPATITLKDAAHFYVMTTSRCQKRVQLTAMGLFTLSCPSFRELLATTGSFLMALWQLRQRVIRQE